MIEWRNFFRWWISQLADWLPESWRKHLASQQTVLRLTPSNAGWQAVLEHAGQQQALETSDSGTENGLSTALADLPPVQRIALQLPASHYLSRSVELPLAASADLTQAIGYQIQTLTPFNRDQIWLFCGEQQRLPDGKRLKAWVVAVPKRVADVFQELALNIEQNPEHGPRRVPEAGAEITLSFRPVQPATGRPPLAWLLTGLGILALMLAVWLHIDNRQIELAELKTQARNIQTKALQASDLAREAEHLQTRLDTLQRHRSGNPLRVAILDELTRVLDDQTWVQRLELRQQQLRLQGVSFNASALIGQLDKSPLFSDIHFDASLTRDPSSGGERFNLTAKINPDAPGEPEDAKP